MITNVFVVILCLLHNTVASYPYRYPRKPLDTSLHLIQEELNPEVSYSYGDSINFNFHDISVPSHNSIEKPVAEPQEYVPPQSVGSASIPLLPPPAVPVNAVAANVPSANGAVYLGSGSIGVVRLSNGAVALGSGALGYSDGRGQPRPSTNVPVYPRLLASPNLIPAAVPSLPPVTPPPQQMLQGFEYRYPVLDNHIQDPNSYEVLRPDRVGFGTPVQRPPRPLRMHFARPTVLVEAQNPQYTLTIPPGIPQTTMNQIQQYIVGHQ